MIADTIPLHFASYRELFREAGVEFSLADYMRVANGAPRHRAIAAVLGEGLPAAELDRLMRRKEELIFSLIEREGLRLIPGSLDVAARFRSLGLRIGMASSSRNAAEFLGRTGGLPLFDAVTDASEGIRAKPFPDVYLRTAERLGVAPAECFAIEDAVVGVRAARTAGMRVLALTTTTPAAELSEADWIVDGFAAIDPARFLEAAAGEG